MNCPHCGERNPDGATQCLHCFENYTSEPASRNFDPQAADAAPVPEVPDAPMDGNTLLIVILLVAIMVGGAMFMMR